MICRAVAIDSPWEAVPPLYQVTLTVSAPERESPFSHVTKLGARPERSAVWPERRSDGDDDFAPYSGLNFSNLAAPLPIAFTAKMLLRQARRRDGAESALAHTLCGAEAAQNLAFNSPAASCLPNSACAIRA